MSFFGALIRTAVNIITLPAKVARDVVDPDSDKGYFGHTREALKEIKKEAED